MKIATDKIPHFFVISCLLHAMLLWGLEARTTMTRERRSAPTIRFVFEDATPAISPARRPVTPKKAVSPPQPRETIKPLPREEAPPEVASTPVLRPENKPQPEQVGIEGLAGEQIIPASVHKIGDTEPTVSRQNILDGYLTIIRAMLERNKEYPLWAKRNNWEGTVRLRFVVSRGGKIEDISVIGSSGFSLLDEAAERTVRRIGKFPSIPKELAMNRLSLDVPLVFKLVNR